METIGKHAIGFVQHQNVYGIESKTRRVANVIDEATGSGQHDVGSCSERDFLRLQ